MLLEEAVDDQVLEGEDADAEQQKFEMMLFKKQTET